MHEQIQATAREKVSKQLKPLFSISPAYAVESLERSYLSKEHIRTLYYGPVTCFLFQSSRIDNFDAIYEISRASRRCRDQQAHLRSLYLREIATNGESDCGEMSLSIRLAGPHQSGRSTKYIIGSEGHEVACGASKAINKHSGGWRAITWATS